MSPLLFIAQAEAPSAFVQLAPMFIIFIIFYFIWFVPLRKKQKALDTMRDDLKKGQDDLKKGQKVITNGGFYGEVVKVEDGIVLLKLGDNIKVRIARDAIAGLERQPDKEGSRS